MDKNTHEELMKRMKLPIEELAKVAGGKDNEERFYALLERKLGISRVGIPLGSTLDDLGADSLDVVDIVKTIEDEFCGRI